MNVLISQWHNPKRTKKMEMAMAKMEGKKTFQTDSTHSWATEPDSIDYNTVVKCIAHKHSHCINAIFLQFNTHLLNKKFG